MGNQVPRNLHIDVHRPFRYILDTIGGRVRVVFLLDYRYLVQAVGGVPFRRVRLQRQYTRAEGLHQTSNSHHLHNAMPL